MTFTKPLATALLGTIALGISLAAPARQASKIIFNRDIRPILSDNCFACHGPDKNKRQANLRLDQPNRAVIPGDIVASQLVQRIAKPASDALAMPPAEFHKTITAAQKETLRRWIGEGATYQKHWAYELPVKPAIPKGKHPIDFLVQRRLAEIGLKPSPQADRRTLIRRLSFDLTGLPPTYAEVQAFINDKSPKAYENLVDRLLASPHYGEKMAQHWLDVVRFADTIGYHSDTPRNIYPYRDYVIKAFNTNKPFDRFTREQLAGDILPGANQETKVGSAFNRLLLTTEEGGAQAKDYEARYLTDRVRAVGTVWLGQTTACAQCHDHKFDPIATRDFYTLGAFFADIEEGIIAAREPGMPVVDEANEKAIAAVDARIAAAEAKVNNGATLLASSRAGWEASLKNIGDVAQNWETIAPTKATAKAGVNLTIRGDKSILASGPNDAQNAYTLNIPATGTLRGVRIDAIPDASLPQRGPGRAGNGNFVLTEVRVNIVDASGKIIGTPMFINAQASFEQTQFAGDDLINKRWGALNTIDNNLRGGIPGWAILPDVGQQHHMVLTFAEPVTIPDGASLQLTLEQTHSNDHNLGCFKVAVAKDATTNGWTVAKPAKVTANGDTVLTVRPDNSILASGPNNVKGSFAIDLPVQNRVTGVRIETLPDPSLPQGGPGRAQNGNFVITEVKGQVVLPDGSLGRTVKFSHAAASLEQTLFAGDDIPGKRWGALHAIDNDAKLPYLGWAILPETGKGHTMVLGLSEPLMMPSGATLRITIENNHSTDHNIGCFRLSTTTAPEYIRTITKSDLAVASIAAIDAGKRTPEQTKQLADAFVAGAPEMASLRDELAAARAERGRIEQMLPRCLVTVQNNTPRTVRILPRGNFLDETGEVVAPATPAFLGTLGLPKKDKLTRLDLADWILSPKNPLTARTVMNRTWKQFFGNGISKVLDDLGAQGAPPTNPALLDYLAVEFRESGWDTKHMVRLMVTSGTYKQVSTASKALMTRDPENRELARQSRPRLEAEEVRDTALQIAGLLVPKIGGPSVKPYQPERYWENLNFPVRDWVADKGESQWRRGLYTWWQRSFLHPSMLAFDAPSREECTAERNRSNIPQQALVLLNDPTYVEAARAFGARIQKEAKGGTGERITWAFQTALQRNPAPAELATLRGVYEKHLASYKADPAAADAYLKTGFAPVPDGSDKPELAAWSHIARILINLHETITRQ
jgi:cytochrome c553